MVDAQKENNVFGGRSCMNSGLVVPRVDTVKENGVATDMETGSSGLGDGLVTYKRRKYSKAVEDGMVSDDSATQLVEKPMKHLSDQASHKGSATLTIASNDCSLNHQRNIVLDEVFQSLESEGGLRKCIQDALSFHPGSRSRTTVKEPIHSCIAGSKYAFETGSACDGHQDVAKGSMCMTFNGSVNELNRGTVTELCRRTFFDIIMSEKFAELCGLVLENGMKANKLLDLSPINSRMKENAYDSSPVLFHSDVQQIWTKLQKVGTDIVALAKCLSDKTKTSFHEQVSSSAYNISEDGRHEFPTQEPDLRKPELGEARSLAEGHTCRHCGEKTDGGNGLVCDSCEEIYHISCIEPTVKDIPVKSWYCTNCTNSTHDNCIACERLKAFRSSIDGEDELVSEQAPEELEESSNEAVVNEGVKRFPNCKVCSTEVKNDEDYRICGHSFCPHKFYHVKCLTSKQLISHGPCWYCPSCLCRVCFIDQDDDNIVLCDGCDHAYHIYCMRPPQSTIPQGKWFCRTCDTGIQRVLKAKRSYQSMKNKSKKIKREDDLAKSGGVDMLLNAAKTLNYEENLAAMGLKAK
ncbi:hypothetical protein BUALT_Bualt08G0114300 [Buddleja alternifolia]|uniref:PHD-type domain-containing protein n=1 Tax=Buddleja alternifolia TaxID=168488 RepID=A0AAV6XDU6_9LAMI|nr:hypothetical protein BUALT_Bualt08G0114300 [Buddleja alternifolia]